MTNRKTEASADQWKRSLMRRMETKVGCSLQEQLHKDEVEEAEFNGAQTEFELSKELFQSLHNRPIISLSTVTGNQDVLNAPCLVLSNVITDSFGWIEDFPIEDTVSAMKHSHQQQLHIGTDVPKFMSDLKVLLLSFLAGQIKFDSFGIVIVNDVLIIDQGCFRLLIAPPPQIYWLKWFDQLIILVKFIDLIPTGVEKRLD